MLDSENKYAVTVAKVKASQGIIAGDISLELHIAPTSMGKGNFGELKQKIDETLNELNQVIENINKR